MRAEHPDILDSIRDKKEITKETGDEPEESRQQIRQGLRVS